MPSVDLVTIVFLTLGPVKLVMTGTGTTATGDGVKRARDRSCDGLWTISNVVQLNFFVGCDAIEIVYFGAFDCG